MSKLYNGSGLGTNTKHSTNLCSPTTLLGAEKNHQFGFNGRRGTFNSSFNMSRRHSQVKFPSSEKSKGSYGLQKNTKVIAGFLDTDINNDNDM